MNTSPETELRQAGRAFSTLATVALTAAATIVGTHLLLRTARRIPLAGKVVLITGGSRGLGLVLARQLAARGARVAICARDTAELDRAVTQLHAFGAVVAAVPCDITNADDCRRLVESVRQSLGPIDVLINNAGTITVAPIQHQDDADYRAAMDLMFWAPKRLTDLVLPDMRRWGGGRIVNISSIGGLIPAPHLAAYVAAKHALVGYSRTCRNELARENIFVTTVTPGLMRTGSPPHVRVKGNVRGEYAWFKIADSLPITSMSADRAAVAIIDALAHGKADLTLTLAARLGARVQSLLPNTSAEVAALMNRALPSPRPGENAPATLGRDAETGLTRTLGVLTDRAAARNNATTTSAQPAKL
jgi:short-subunit dehydrogenase